MLTFSAKKGKVNVTFKVKHMGIKDVCGQSSHVKIFLKLVMQVEI